MVLAEYARMFQMRIRDVLRLMVLPAVVVIVLVAMVIAAIWWGGR
jgi:hypothetical protein